MEARLSAVQKGLVLVLISSVVLLVLGRPEPHNRSVADAHKELTAFRAGFQRSQVESSLRAHAEAQGALKLSEILPGIQAMRGPEVNVAPGAAEVRPVSTASLGSLEQVAAAAAPSATLAIGTLDPQALGKALSWRLSRVQPPSSFTLRAVELRPGLGTRESAALQQAVAELRLALLDAQAEVDAASRKLENAIAIFDARRKRGLPWKELVDFYDARNAARASLDEKKKQLALADQRYQNEATRAEQLAQAAGGGATDVAQAQVRLEREGKLLRINVPVALTIRQVPVPPLRGGSFPATREAGLWDELKKLSAQQAIPRVERHFNWHYRHVTLAGIDVGGMTVLALLPCAVLAFIVLTLLRTRTAMATYSPFRTSFEALPTVGFKSRALELLVLVLLPFLGSVSAALSLLMIDRVPVLPALCAAASLVLGGYTFSKLGELKDLVVSVVRTSSYPPPQRSS